MRIPLRKLYLTRMVATCLALVAFGFVFTVYVLSEWVLGPALDPAMRPPHWAITAFLVACGVLFIVGGGLLPIIAALYYLVTAGIRVAKGRTGIILDADGYTDLVMLQLIPVRISWENVQSIATEADEGSPIALLCVRLKDDSVYQGYSSFKRFMTHTMYISHKNLRRYAVRRKFGWRYPDYPPIVAVGLMGRQAVIQPFGLPVDAEYLSTLMNSYLSAWRKEHRHRARRSSKQVLDAHVPACRALTQNEEE